MCLHHAMVCPSPSSSSTHSQLFAATYSYCRSGWSDSVSSQPTTRGITSIGRRRRIGTAILLTSVFKQSSTLPNIARSPAQNLKVALKTSLSFQLVALFLPNKCYVISEVFDSLGRCDAICCHHGLHSLMAVNSAMKVSLWHMYGMR